jgi:hypothetical protein
MATSTLNIKAIIATLNSKGIRQNVMQTLNVIMQNVAFFIGMLGLVMLCIDFFIVNHSVVMLNVVMLGVAAPFCSRCR